MGGGDIKQHGLDAHLWRSTHRMGRTGPTLYHSSRRLSTLAHRCVGPLFSFSKLQSSFRNKEPLRPICYSRRTQLQQCVTHYKLTLSWLPFFLLWTNALTFGDFSQLFPSLYFFFALSTFSLLWWLPLSCFVLLFCSLDFYGDCKLPRNNDCLGIKKREWWWTFHKQIGNSWDKWDRFIWWASQMWH